MAVLADRVKETTATTGTGSLTLLGAVTGYRSFSAASITTGYYVVDDGQGNWEVGQSLTISGATLTRDLVLSSSNAGALVNFGPGPKTVHNDVPAGFLLGLVATAVPDGDKGDLTTSGGGTVWTIDADAVTYAKMQNIPVTQRVLGRNTAGAGDTEEVTLSQLLDWASSTQGTLLYRGASTWAGLAPGTAGNVLQSGGAGANPSWTTLAGTVTNVATSFGLTGGPITTTGTLSISTSAPPSGNDTAINCGVDTSVSASALTVTLTDAAGATPSSTSPVLIPFRSSTAATGTITWRAVTGATTLVISSGSTMGTANATSFAVWLVAFDDAGTVRLGLINCLSGTDIYPLGAYPIASSTAEGGAGAADSAHVFYTGTAVSSKAYTILARLSWETGLATAGTWSASATREAVTGPHTRLPGERVQIVVSKDGAVATGTTTIPFDDTIPQNSEGTQFMSKAITPVSAANILDVRHQGNYMSSVANAFAIALFQDSTAGALAATVGSTSSTNFPAAGLNSITHIMLAATTSATTFKIRAGANSAHTTTFNGQSAARLLGGSQASVLIIEEIAA